MKRVTVNLGDRAYDVVVGHDVTDETSSMIPNGVTRVALVTQEGIPDSLLPDLGRWQVSHHVIGAGEEHKTMSTIERLCEEFAARGLTRADVVVGVGGGMVTDVAGFAASVYHRGIAVVHVATTLLAMIDAAVGGKTGVNLSAGKNLVGAFWQPRGVVCDLRALDTLPEREYRCGTGEMAKYHFIVREDLSSLDLEDRIARCVKIKADIVGIDEREGGARALLNYGHTMGHALETESRFSLAHGEAVALGLLFAAELARVLGRVDAARVEDHYRVVHEVYGLRVGLPPAVTLEGLMDAMTRDKKAVDGLTFVLDSTIGLEVVPRVGQDAVRAAHASWIAGIGR